MSQKESEDSHSYDPSTSDMISEGGPPHVEQINGQMVNNSWDELSEADRRHLLKPKTFLVTLKNIWGFVPSKEPIEIIPDRRILMINPGVRIKMYKTAPVPN